MRHFVGTALLALLAAGCGDPEIFDRVAAPESAGVAEAPYPKLADTPPAAPAGVYTTAAPNPAKGDNALIELSAEASTAEARRAKIEGPVE